MGRRRGHWTEASRTVLTYSGLNKARQRLYVLEKNVIAATCEFPPFTQQDMLDFLLNADALAKVKAAAPYLGRGYNYGDTSVGCPHPKCEVVIDKWSNIKLPSLSDAAVDIKPEAAPLWAYATSINEIRKRFALCHYVLKWMDKNTTAGAFKYYWPCVLSLYQNDDVQNAGERFKPPVGIAPLLPFLRTTAETIAAALMAPEYKRPEASDHKLLFALKFPQTEINIHPEHEMTIEAFSWVLPVC